MKGCRVSKRKNVWFYDCRWMAPVFAVKAPDFGAMGLRCVA
jgi:hypothetical protein